MWKSSTRCTHHAMMSISCGYHIVVYCGGSEIMNYENPGLFVRVTLYMMTSSNGNIFRVTGPFCGEFTGHRWIPHTKASDANFDVFFDLRRNKPLSKQSWGWWFEKPSRSLWRHCNENSVAGFMGTYVVSLWFTLRRLMAYICVSELGHHLFN